MVDVDIKTREEPAMVRAAIRDLELPDERAAEQAADAVEQLTAFLRAHPTPTTHVQLVSDNAGEEPTSITVPAVAFRFFIDVLAELANGNAVTVAPVHAELTSQQAADLLNVSRPYLIKLLDKEQIPFRRVGNRRKILLTHLLEYKRRDEAHRRDVATKLTEEAELIGLEY